MPGKSFLFLVAACFWGWTTQAYASGSGDGTKSDVPEVAGDGPRVTQSRSVSAYGRIVVDAPVAVDVVDGARWAFEISGCADQLKRVRSKVSGGRSKTIRAAVSKDRLTISAKASVLGSRDGQPVRIVLTVPGGLSAIELSGGAQMNVTKPLESGSFSIRMKGMSRLTVSHAHFGALKAKLSGGSYLGFQNQPGIMHLKVKDHSVLKSGY